mgnify:FL=1
MRRPHNTVTNSQQIISYLHFSSDPNKNIALNKPARQISTYAKDEGGGNASLAVDGRLDYYSHTGGTETSEQWWIVDLLEEYTISKIRVIFREFRKLSVQRHSLIIEIRNQL